MNAVIFDMDGLLVDSEILYVYAFKEVCEVLNINYDEYIYKKCTGTTKSTQELILKEHYGQNFEFEKCYNLTHEIMEKYINSGRLALKDGVCQILNLFKEKGFKMAVASSNSTKQVELSLNITGIYNFFDEIVTGNMVENGKPNPEIFLLACDKLGSSPDKTYVFEDSYNGVRAGHSGGFYTIMVPDLLKPTEEMHQKADEIIESLSLFKL